METLLPTLQGPTAVHQDRGCKNMPPLPHCCAEMPPGCAPGEGGTAASHADMRPPQCMGGPRAAHSSPCRIVINWRNVYFLIPWWGRQQRRWWGEGWGAACPLLPPACGLQQIVVLPLRCLPCWPGALTKKKKKVVQKPEKSGPLSHNAFHPSPLPQCLSPSPPAGANLPFPQGAGCLGLGLLCWALRAAPTGWGSSRELGKPDPTFLRVPPIGH